MSSFFLVSILIIGNLIFQVAAVSFVSFIIAGIVQSAVVCMIIAIVLMIATLLVIKAITAKKHAGIFQEMAEADKALYNK